jgi:hypothetical protein
MRGTPTHLAFRLRHVSLDVWSPPFARTIPLVMDDLKIHCQKSLADFLGELERKRAEGDNSSCQRVAGPSWMAGKAPKRLDA